MKILVTGGSGYIGSHTVLTLLENGHDVVVVDNLLNSTETSLQRVATLAGRAPVFHRADLLDEPRLRAIFAEEQVDAVMDDVDPVGAGTGHPDQLVSGGRGRGHRAPGPAQADPGPGAENAAG